MGKQAWNFILIGDVFYRNQTELGRAENWEIAKQIVCVYI